MTGRGASRAPQAEHSGPARNNPFAAIVTRIGRIAGHGTAALHTLLVVGHRRQTVRKLQAQESDRSQKHHSLLSIILVRLRRIRRASQPKDTSSAVDR